MKYWPFLAFLLLFLSTAVFAQTNNSSNTDIAPNNHFYFLKSWQEGFKNFFTINLKNKIEPFFRSAKVENQNNYKDYNVIIVAFDGLQAKHLRSYGYNKNPAPNLEKFLKRSYLFTNAISPAPWTVPSFMSIFTSLYPSEHKVVNKFVEYSSDGKKTKAVKANLKELNPSAVTLAEILKKNGYATGGFTGDAGVSAAFGYGSGFDEYFEGDTFGGFDQSIPRAMEWLDKNKDNKFFMFLHGYDVHGQYAPKEGFDYRYAKKSLGKYTGSPKEQAALREEGIAKGELNLSASDVNFWRGIYDEKINRADKKFSDFMQYVEKLGLMKNTIIVVLSDHGTEFYEHKRFDHGHTLYGELVDVLFSIRLPNQKYGEKVSSLVSTLDVAPTLLNLLNIKDSATRTMKGIDLSPALNGKDISRDIYSETDYRLYTHKRSIQTPGGWKFILTMENLYKELYNLKNDPTEQRNVVNEYPKIAYELEQKIYVHLKSMNANGPWPIGCLPVYADQCQVSTSSESLVPNTEIAGKPNVVIINIDSLRADHMGIYGYKKNTTPFLDSLFKTGVIFKNAITPAYLTFQTDASIFSSLYPSQNNVRQWTTKLNDKVPLLPKILGVYGYKTAAFVSPSLWPSFGFDKLFDNYTLNKKVKNIDEAKKSVADWMSSSTNPFFVFWHIYDAHLPYHKPTAEFYNKNYNSIFSSEDTGWNWEGQSINSIDKRENNTIATTSAKTASNKSSKSLHKFTDEDIFYLLASYDSGVRYVDDQLRNFFADIKDKPFFKNTVFIISSEHGEDLKEHGFIFHRDLYDVNTKVPLAIIAPGVKPQEITQTVSLLDIMPTILDMAGVSEPQNIEGESLKFLLEGKVRSGSRDIFTERSPFDEYSIRRGSWKYILRNPEKKTIAQKSSGNDTYDSFMKRMVVNDIDTGDELYNLSSDPDEKNNLIGTGLKIESELKETIYKFSQRMKEVREYNKSIKSVVPTPGPFIPYP